MKSALTRTQAVALLRFAGKPTGNIQSNHYLIGVRACVRKGLISQRYEGVRVIERLTAGGEIAIGTLLHQTEE